jgi:hypothetical protein
MSFARQSLPPRTEEELPLRRAVGREVELVSAVGIGRKGF